MTMQPAKGGTRFNYDVREWRRLCKYTALDSPILCLLERGADGQGTERR
jgi:hypothetical protein